MNKPTFEQPTAAFKSKRKKQRAEFKAGIKELADNQVLLEQSCELLAKNFLSRWVQAVCLHNQSIAAVRQNLIHAGVANDSNNGLISIDGASVAAIDPLARLHALVDSTVSFHFSPQEKTNGK